MAVTVFQLLNYRKSVVSTVGGQYAGQIEQDTPTTTWAPQMLQDGQTSIECTILRVELPQPTSNSAPSSSSAPRLPPTATSSQDPKYANMPAGIVESMAVAASRMSLETTSSMDPDQYLVSDGFRPCERPPSYTSSRESSLGPPEYRSRPPSLHAIVMVGSQGQM